jgi:uncharacterized protein YjdB
MPRYSSLQLEPYTNKDYRVKDYQNKEWISVIRNSKGWTFKWKTFRTANELNKYLKEENKMAEQNETHFQVQDENKARKFEANKKKREEVKQFIDRCDERKLTEIHAEVTRLKRGFYL